MEIGKNVLIRHLYYFPRENKFTPDAEDCPISLDFLSENREFFDDHNRRFNKRSIRFKIESRSRKETSEQMHVGNKGQTSYISKKNK